MILTETEIERLVELLHAEPGFEHAQLAAPPQPLTGGYWASISLLRLANVAPPADSLVLRVMPDPSLATKETVFQREIASQGFPTPVVRLAGGAEAGLGGAFMLMDHAPGDPPLAGLDGIAALRQLPSLARGLPDLLGRITAALHALDSGSVRTALAEAGAAAPSDTLTFLALLMESADRIGCTDLSEAARWLSAHPPAPGRQVIGHGDLHPFNLLVDGKHWTLLDWSTALVTDPAYDLAFTTMMLSHPPLVAPAPLRPVIRVAGAAVARRFLAAYQKASGHAPDQQTMDWYTSLHALRILVEFEGWRRDPAGIDRSSHPWTALSPVAALALSRTTTTTVIPISE